MSYVQEGGSYGVDTATPGEFRGWAVSAAIYRETDAGFEVRTRPYTVGTFALDDALRYAQDETVRDYPSADGWHIILSAMQVRLSGDA